MKYRLSDIEISSEEIRKRLGYFQVEHSVKEPTYETVDYKIIDNIFEKYYDQEKSRWKNSLTLIFHALQLQDIYVIKNVFHTELFSALCPIEANRNHENIEDSFSIQWFDEDEIPEKFRLKCDKPFIVYANYPIDPAIKITIDPAIIYYPELEKEIHYFHIGYIVWQVVKVYVDIFLHRTGQFNFGHAFTDLALGSLQLFEGNCGLIDFSS